MSVHPARREPIPVVAHLLDNSHDPVLLIPSQLGSDRQVEGTDLRTDNWIFDWSPDACRVPGDPFRPVVNVYEIGKDSESQSQPKAPSFQSAYE